MLEMPDMFERYMKLGQTSFETEDYIEAKGHFESAYELKDEIEASKKLVKTLIALKEFQTAYLIIVEKKKEYIKNPDLTPLYFEVLLQLNYFFEIEKLLAIRDLKGLDDYQKAYAIAKEYHLLLYREKLKTIKMQIENVDKAQAFRQGVIIKEIKYLPKEMALPLIQNLLVNPEVSLFSRNELVQQLVLIKEEEPMEVLTYNNEIKTFVASKLETLKETYQNNTVLKEVCTYLDQHQPSLRKEIQQVLTLHIGCLYPFEKEIMTPTNDWVTSYLVKYGVVSQIYNNELIEKIQGDLDQEVLKLMSFH